MGTRRTWMLLLLAAAVLAWSATPVAALTITVDGDPSDWGIAPGEWGTSVWTPADGVQGTWPPAEDDYPDGTNSGYVGPGYGGQDFDAEAIYFTYDDEYAYFALVTGMPPKGARNEFPGDIILRFGQDPTWTHAIETTGGNSLVVGALYEEIEWEKGLWGTTDPAGIASGTEVWAPESPNLVYTKSSGEHYVLEVAIPLSVLPRQEMGYKPFAAQWTQTCGNDGVAMHGDLPPVHMPEPTTLALFGLALAGLRARRRRR